MTDRQCVYTHTLCSCDGNDATCRELAIKELKRSREAFAKAGGMNIVEAQAEQYRLQGVPIEFDRVRPPMCERVSGWQPVRLDALEEYTRELEAILAHDTFAGYAPQAMGDGSSPPKKQPPAANRCPGCARKIPDNKQHCGRPGCYDVAKHGKLGAAIKRDERGAGIDAAIDAMHRQRGVSPFSLRYQECKKR